MKLPENAAAFVDSVKSDSKQLIERGLWDIRMPRFESWSRQFCGLEEHFFAACLLDQLIFRTAHQFEAGLKTLFRSNLNGQLFSDNHDLHLSKIISERDDPELRLVPVICDTDPPTKSGPLVLRRLQRILKVHQEWMCWPWQTTKSIENHKIHFVVFVDDFLGSGHQFITFFKQWNFHNYTEGVKYFYTPVVAHQQGIDHLKKQLPAVCVVPAEKLDNSHSFFSSTVWDRLGQGFVSAEVAKAWYEKFAKQKDFCPDKVGIFGYDNLSLTFGFSHSTPNNTLPIFWYESTNWKPLLER